MPRCLGDEGSVEIVMATGRSDEIVRVLGRRTELDRAAVWRAEVVPPGRRHDVVRLSWWQAAVPSLS